MSLTRCIRMSQMCFIKHSPPFPLTNSSTIQIYYTLAEQSVHLLEEHFVFWYSQDNGEQPGVEITAERVPILYKDRKGMECLM